MTEPAAPAAPVAVPTVDPHPRSVTVVGASLAGHATVRALRRSGFAGTITVIGDEHARPYDRPPLSKAFLSGAVTEADLSLEGVYESLDASWLLGVRATALDASTRTVTLADGRAVRSDAVVIATGSTARRMPNAPPGVHTVRTLADAAALRGELRPGARLAVIGAGFIGAEVASTAHGMGLEVTVIEAAPTPLAGPLGPEMGAVVAGLHSRHGVRLLCGVPVAGLLGVERVTGVLLADGTEVAADVVVAGIGAVPAVDWLRDSGVDISAPPAGGVVCDAVGFTGTPGVYAVGDCSAWFDDVRGRHHRIEHWTDSRDRPTVLVAAMLGVPSATPLRAPYFWSDQYGVKIQFAGRREGDEEVTVEAGGAATDDLLAVYRRNGIPVAVLGLDQPKLFTRWRKLLAGTSTTAAVLDRS